MNKAIFLDRDGILIDDVGYPHRRQDLRIKEDIIPFLIKAQASGFLLIIVTNQSGIARGIFSLEEYHALQKILIDQLKKRGVKISKTYFCPYHKDGNIAPYNVDSPDRKPGTGMFLKASNEFQIDLEKSFMIGDKMSDNIPGINSLILASPYTRGESNTYQNFATIFAVILGSKPWT